MPGWETVEAMPAAFSTVWEVQSRVTASTAPPVAASPSSTVRVLSAEPFTRSAFR